MNSKTELLFCIYSLFFYNVAAFCSFTLPISIQRPLPLLPTDALHRSQKDEITPSLSGAYTVNVIRQLQRRL